LEFLKSGEEIPEWFVDSFDIQPKDHFEMQQTVQKHVDAAVSKTINLPHDTTVDDLDSLLLESVKDLKGVTVYRDGCREGQPLTVMSEDKVKQHLNLNKKTDNSFKIEDVQCASGSCEI
jgi:ribonucleoside-diphosphate reductase alpha chain